MRTTRRVARFAAPAAVVLGLVTSGCSGNSNAASTTTNVRTSSADCRPGASSSVVAEPGYRVCLFVGATTKAYHPDEVRVVGDRVWVGWQNGSAKDGSTTKPSTVAEYTDGGTLVRSWQVVGHADGMRWNPVTRTMWVTTNEDAKPRLYVIDPSSATATQYTVPPTSWGGGLDDIEFIGGSAYISASNPTLNGAGKNPGPAIVKVTLSGTTAVWTAALPGETTANSLNPPVTKVPLTLTDPDSMTLDPQGDLVFLSQADSDLLFIHGIGTPQRTVKVLTVGTQIDDTIWPTSTSGCLLVADNSSGVFSVCSSLWVPGSPVASSPNDATVINFVGTLSLSSGQLTPFLVGMGNPHGMAFLPK